MIPARTDAAIVRELESELVSIITNKLAILIWARSNPATGMTVRQATDEARADIAKILRERRIEL